MEFKGIRVLVLDGYGRQSGIMCKELKELGCHVTTVNSSRLDVGYATRYPDKRIIGPSVNTDVEGYKILLENLIKSGDYDVVFPMLEKSTRILCERYEEYGRFVKLCCANPDAFFLAFDKQATMEMCRELDIPIPRTKSDNESLDSFLSQVTFPLMCKPRSGIGSHGIQKVTSRTQLETLIGSGQINVDEYIIQEFIPKADLQRVTYIFIDDAGKVRMSIGNNATRHFPVGGGTPNFYRSANFPETNAYAEKLLHAMNWHGFASVCFLEGDEEKIPKVIEINGRISGSIRTSWMCGYSVARLFLERAYGCSTTTYSPTIPEDLRLRESHADLLWFLKSPERFTTNPSWFSHKNEQDVIFLWDDPLPFFTFGIQGLKNYKKIMANKGSK